MSPTIKFLDGEYDHKPQITRSGVVINGPRPTPLKLRQESHTIHKVPRHPHHQQQKIRKPIIIYIRSPEVIHTKPHDFMALVQKLTGPDHNSASKHQQQQHHKKTLKKQVDGASYDPNDDDINELINDSGDKHDQGNNIMKPRSPMFNTPANPRVYDIPLFTPNMSDYFFSPQRFFRFSDN